VVTIDPRIPTYNIGKGHYFSSKICCLVFACIKVNICNRLMNFCHHISEQLCKFKPFHNNTFQSHLVLNLQGSLLTLYRDKVLLMVTICSVPVRIYIVQYYTKIGFFNTNVISLSEEVHKKMPVWRTREILQEYSN
jgi:hypothetical protein